MKSQIMRHFMQIQLIILQIISIQGAHFQGGIITWKYKNNQVYVTYKLSFNSHHCDNATILNRELISGEVSLTCFKGCDSSSLTSTLKYYCTDYSVDENWTYGQRTVNIIFPSTADNVYVFGYSGCCWSKLFKSSGDNWLLLATANLNIRQDNGRINTSPISSMQPVITLKQNCSYSLKIPVVDEDDDVVRCRWANNSLTDECRDVCNGFKHSILDQKNCILYINTTISTGRYVVALQIEDFQTEQDTNAFSSIPLQFIIQIIDDTSMCDEKPSIEMPASLGSVISIPPNTMYNQTIVARSLSSRISEINTVSPVGMLKSGVYKYVSSSHRWYVNVTWTPTTEDIGIHIFCYTAINEDRQSSDQECKTLKITDAKGCASNPCPNGASCSEQVHGYICIHNCGTDSKFGEIAEETCISEMCTECRITDKQHGFSVQLLSLE